MFSWRNHIKGEAQLKSIDQKSKVKIKSGLQFRNYIYDDIVIKKRRNLIEVFLNLFRGDNHMIFHPIKLINTSIGSYRYTKRHFEHLKLIKHLYPFLSIIKIEKDLIIQNKAITLLDYFKEHSLNNNKSMIIDYFEFLHKIWSHGFFEESFKFLENFGVLPDGKITLIDVGELCFEKQKLEAYIKQKIWLIKGNYRYGLKGKLKVFYKKKADEYLTLEQLDKHWKKAYS